MPNYISVQQVHKLMDTILSGGLATPETREVLLTGINPGYVALLPLRRSPLNQLQSDLVAMNSVPHLTGYEVPLRIWLENAVHQLRRSGRVREQTLFQEVLNKVATKSDAVIREAKDA